jgi:hypothetical protein
MMPITELENFRKKYPQYSDMDDGALAERLAAKYPEAYADLPAKVQPSSPQPEIDPNETVISQGAGERVRPGQIASQASEPQMEQEIQPQEWKDLPGNIPGSAVQFGKDIYQAARHPVETAKAVGGLAAGYAQKVVPEEHRHPEYEQTADAFSQAMVDRYGGMENLKQTVVSDPVGFLADIASVVTGVGGAVRGVGHAGKIPQVSRAGQAVSQVGQAMEPVNLALKTAVSPAKLVSQERIQRAYGSAVKFHQMPLEKRKRITQTALDNAIIPTAKGFEKLQSSIDGINNQIASTIDAAVDTGQRIPVSDLFKHFNALEKQILATSGDPVLGQKAINNVKKHITEANKQLGRDSLSPLEAQQMKVKIYKEMETAYDKMVQLPAKTEAKMAVAKSLKEGIEEIVPEIKQLNQKDGALIELRKEIEKTTRRLSNRDLIGIGVPIKGGAGAGMGYAFGQEAAIAGATLGMILGFIETPGVKSRLAVVLNRMKQQGIVVKPTPTLTRLGLMQAGRASDIVEKGAENP